jgi:hypothetical protein
MDSFHIIMTTSLVSVKIFFSLWRVKERRRPLVPVTVVYCPHWTMPPEYCEYGPFYEERCLSWKQQHENIGEVNSLVNDLEHQSMKVQLESRRFVQLKLPSEPCLFGGCDSRWCASCLPFSSLNSRSLVVLSTFFSLLSRPTKFNLLPWWFQYCPHTNSFFTMNWVRHQGRQWTIYRRYREFEESCDQLFQESLFDESDYPLPKKTLVSNSTILK